jgi:type I restriction enzyme S subunit
MMSRSTKIMLVPKLRFPEFRKSTEWTYLKGDEMFDQITNKDHNSDLPILAITQEHGAIPRDQIDYNVIVTDRSLESYKVVEVDDFIISLRSFQGGIEYSNYKGICSPAYVILRRKTKSISDFFRHYFKTHPFIQDLNKNLEGLRDGKMVSYKQFSDLMLPSPLPKEQQKIADCLSSLDNVITVENQKLETLRVHKKGLMQHLFPAEGEKVPKLRFKEFRNDAKWEETILEDILIEAKLGGNYENSDANKGIPVIKMGNLDRGKMNTDRIQYLPEDEEYNEDDVLNRGDLLFNTRNTLELVGKVAIWRDELPFAIYNSNLLRLKFKHERVASSFFMNYALNTQYALSKLRRISTGTTSVAAIYGKDLYSMSLDLPRTIAEQQKIADCLLSHDDLITEQSQKLEALKAHKKGLTQQLFPNVNEK